VAEVFRAEWLAQLASTTPLDLFEIWGAVRLPNVPNVCTTRSSRWTSRVREYLRIQTLETISQSTCSDHIYWPRYEHFWCGADRASCMLGRIMWRAILLFWFFMVFKLLVRFDFSFRLEADKIFARGSGVRNSGVQRKAQVQLQGLHKSWRQPRWLG
jgi:hypothetical protein